MQPTNYFEELKLAVNTAADNKSLYTMMSSVYMRCLNEFTRGKGLPLSSPFAKTDYLLKEHKATRELTRDINDTRQYFRYRKDKSETELREHYRQDLRNLCEFIALLTGEAAPATLKKYYPEKPTGKTTPPPVRLGEYLRVVVESWDNDYAYCQSETASEETLKICYSHDNKAYNFDWTYLRELFYKGAQFNLVRPYKSGDEIYPELWIFEPDYLVNISSIAACFEGYAHSAMVGIMKRIMKSETKPPMLLGDLASQLLDESIHQMDSRPYRDSAKDFFSNYATKILATDGMGPDFHTQAKAQKVNISRAMHETLPKAIKDFDSKNGIVEPSFFSEMLGLQGRMDYLQLGMKVLIEQKSGKGEFIPYDNSYTVPREKLEHSIQLLLYMAVLRYNYRKQYEDNNRELHAFLLYSKYTESLIDLHFLPEKLFEAFVADFEWKRV